MPVPNPCSPENAAAMFEPVDRLGIPLGPGQPTCLLRALGQRTDWVDLRVFGALLVELFPLFAHKGVRMRSGFFGPAERALRAAGHDIEFVPGGFSPLRRDRRTLRTAGRRDRGGASGREGKALALVACWSDDR